MKSLVKFLISLGIVVAFLGLLLSAALEMPQHGLRLFLGGFGILVFAIVASNINSWVGEGCSVSNRPLAISSIGFGIIAIVQISAVFASLSEKIQFIGTIMGGALMLAGIVRHLFNIRSN